MRTRISIFFLVLTGLGVVVAGWLWQGETGGSEGMRLQKTGTQPQSAGMEVTMPVRTGSRQELRVPREWVSRLRSLLGRPGVRAGEGLLTFSNEKAYRDFLTRARSAGVTVLGMADRLRSVRVRVENYDQFARELQGHAGEYETIAANPILQAPVTPPAEERTTSGQVPVGDKLLATLGVTGDNATWGKGVLIAVLDSGVVPDPAFGTGRLQALDVGQGMADSGGGGGRECMARPWRRSRQE